VSRQTRFDRPAAVRRGRRPRDAAHVHLRGDENRRISMNEMIFGSGSPMWSAMPSIGLAYQPMSVTNRPIGAPLFSSPAIAGAIGGGLTGAPVLSAQQNLSGSGYVAPYPFAPSPSSTLIGADVTGLVTAASL